MIRLPHPSRRPALATRPAGKRKGIVAEKRGRGRPTLYRPEYATQAAQLALLGATNPDLARFFGVADSTVDKWIGEHDDFSGALKAGREYADAKVAKSLYRRALGYSHPAVKIVADAKTGAEHSVPYVERYPPETTACIFWLKNRRPDLWRDKQDVEHSGSVGLSRDQRLTRVAALLKAAKARKP